MKEIVITKVLGFDTPACREISVKGAKKTFNVGWSDRLTCEENHRNAAAYALGARTEELDYGTVKVGEYVWWVR